MANIYIYNHDAEDFSTTGICGKLLPTECTFTEEANGESYLELEHPMDEAGKYLELEPNRLLKVQVPVLSVSGCSEGGSAAEYKLFKVLTTAQERDRRMYWYKTLSNTATKGLIPFGQIIKVYNQPTTERWRASYDYTIDSKNYKIASKTYTHWFYITGAETAFECVDEDPEAEEVVKTWELTEQLFRITSVEKTLERVRVEAKHVFYDMLCNLSLSGEISTYVTPGTLMETLFEYAASPDIEKFNFLSNITATATEFIYRNKDFVTVMLDEDEGLVAKYGGYIIRDNYTITHVDDAGEDSGVTLEYGKNIKGLTLKMDFENVVTALRPIGKYTKGDDERTACEGYQWLWSGGDSETWYSGGHGIYYGRWHTQYPETMYRAPATGEWGTTEGNTMTYRQVFCRLPFARIEVYEDDAFDVTTGLTAEQSMYRRVDYCRKRFQEEGLEIPEIKIKVKLALLSSSEQYAELADLEAIHLYDIIHVKHPDMNVDFKAKVTQIEWDCVHDVLDSIKAEQYDFDITA